MDKESLNLISQMLKEGHRATAIKNEFIARGLSTKDFYEHYYKIIDELGLKEINLSSPADDYAAAYYVNQARSAGRKHNFLTNFFKGLLVVLVLGFLVWVILSGVWKGVLGQLISGGDSSQDNLSTADLAHEVNLKKTAQTAKIYKNKILDYSGLCKSIGLESAYRCAENKENYAIEVRLSTGQYYCIDSTGFTGVVENSFGKRFVCGV